MDTLLEIVSVILIALVVGSCVGKDAGFEKTAAKFENDDGHRIYFCRQDRNIVVTELSCDNVSSDHIVVSGFGLTGGMIAYINMCNDNNHVKIFGYTNVVGEPKFSYKLPLWSEYSSLKDSLNELYKSQSCYYIYKI
jgi:hypothetical protein